jgi:8-oxo-dGTP diphosphatase
MEREYPKQPIAGIGAVAVCAGKVLLVQRANPPMQGRWTLPGGVLELGESLADSVAREVREETGLQVEVLDLVEVVERIDYEDSHDGDRVRYHYIIADYLCRVVGGELHASSDASAAVWAASADFDALNLDLLTRQVSEKGLRLAAQRGF